MRGLSTKVREGLTSGGVLLGLAIVGGRMAPAEAAEPVAEHQVITLWPGGTPGAKGQDPDHDVPTLTALACETRCGNGRGCGGLSWRRVWNAGDGPRRQAGRRVAQLAGGLGVRAQIPAWPAVSPSRHAPGRGTSHSHCPGNGAEMGRRHASNRDPRLFRGRTSGLDGRHALRRWQAGRRGSGGTRQLAS